MIDVKMLKNIIHDAKEERLGEDNISDNPYRHEYIKGYVVALSYVEGIISELEEPDFLICPKCGLEVHRDFRNCPRCGAKTRG